MVVDLRFFLIVSGGILTIYHFIQLFLALKRHEYRTRRFAIFLLCTAMWVGLTVQITALIGFEAPLHVGENSSIHEFWLSLPIGPYSAALICYPEPGKEAAKADSKGADFYFAYTMLQNEKVIASGSGLGSSQRTHHLLGDLNTLAMLDPRKTVHVIIRVHPLNTNLPPMSFVIETADELRYKSQGLSLRPKSFSTGHE